MCVESYGFLFSLCEDTASDSATPFFYLNNDSNFKFSIWFE